jgi:tetratricopeptide (TPR) repeat protein
VEGAAHQRRQALSDGSIPLLLREPLDQITDLLAKPGEAIPGIIADACRSIAAWAIDERHLATAISYLQVVILLDPRDAATAYQLARTARRHGEGQRAETWFHYSVHYARRNRDWATYSLAFIGVGNLHGERGNYPAAKRSLMRALRASRRHGIRAVEAMALHDLFTTALHSQSYRAAERLAAAAAEAYGAGHPRLPHLAHDLAVLWIEQGQFEPALEVLSLVYPQIAGFPERMIVASSLARAAAGAGRTDVYERARGETESMLPETDSVEGVAPTLLNLARAAASMGDRVRAREWAERTCRVARHMREGKVRLEAEAVLEWANTRREEFRTEFHPSRQVLAPEVAGHVAHRFSELLGVGTA